MNSNFTRLLATVIVALWLSPHQCSAQNLQKALNNPVIMTYYTAEQLQTLDQTDSSALNDIIYYFTQSFIVEPIDCFECLPFDSSAFDISKWEYLRLDSTVYTREFTKYGFTLTLYPVSQLPADYRSIHYVPRIDPGEINQQR